MVGPGPCNADACAEGSDLPQCLEYTQQYCQLRNDTGCDFFRPRYEVPAEKPAELTVTESAGYSSEQV